MFSSHLKSISPPKNHLRWVLKLFCKIEEVFFSNRDILLQPFSVIFRMNTHTLIYLLVTVLYIFSVYKDIYWYINIDISLLSLKNPVWSGLLIKISKWKHNKHEFVRVCVSLCTFVSDCVFVSRMESQALRLFISLLATMGVCVLKCRAHDSVSVSSVFFFLPLVKRLLTMNQFRTVYCS